REYLEAGCDVITANTFGANPLKLAGSGYKTEEVIKAAVEIARQAAETSSAAKSSSVPGKKYVALDMGPTGKLLEPMGTLSFDDAYESFRRCAVAGEEAGADLVIIETMSDLYETKAAVLAVRENTRLPVIACVTFQDNGRMLTGADALTAVTVLESFGADAVGFNCVGDLSLAQELAETFLRYARVPVIVQPNAGIPVLENGKTVFRISPAEFASAMQSLAAAGVRITGGCCGTTPEHIAEVIRHCRETVLSALPPLPAGGRPEGTRISSFCRTETIGGRAGTGDGPRIIGERINPTGKKRLKQALSDGDMQYILNEGAVQVEAGAHILDVNVGLPGTDEAALMVGAVRELQRALPVPLQLDSSDPAVLERGLRYYNGKALVNSVNGKRSSMDAVFPLIRKYGGAVIALALDETGIPDTAAGRLAIARRILGRALEYGISPSDIIVDPLTLTVSSNQDEAKVTLEAVRMIKAELGLPTVLGVSNISFGLPQRELITSTFLALALEAGLDACIINPCSAQIMGSWYSWRVLAGYDRNSLTYIEKYTGAAVTAVETAPAAPKAPEQEKKASGVPSSKDETPPSGPESELRRLIVGGFREQSSAVTGELLKKYSPVEIIDRQIVPALDEVGRDFESGKKFLPQLLLSADTVAAAFDVIKAHLERSGQKRADKGTVLLATVYGDIHDIGKNIVKAMLENYGYTVIDMGKNVEPQAIVDCIRENAVLGKDIPLVGLSALMTTTVSSMEQTIQAIREADLDTKIMVGGAVLTADYAEKIGADYYAKDAMASVAIAKTVFKELSDK
ncbi:MAG: homocysteine S-methyltransferase family protein, partial [Spirochaetaceae bacterium]|nr:homocysteine S-methyltransferase family protein [Spirochaetaceae bacterium]